MFSKNTKNVAYSEPDSVESRRPDFDYADAEARHLQSTKPIAIATTNSPKKKSSPNTTSSSALQATDFGEALARHDEF
ncbi:hypothetical protein KQX54_018800 [Cotesia glomerata]|uniref:Uncharacterized protein n=1 Tax=Cotesia glomerata TaxID=32391 RepID=A0AAV7IN30_COTGL|nr:hypothetical protein KQX54_018800 [Cotesia glomerata]